MADLERTEAGAAAAEAGSPADIMMQFMSLGQNCEFGFAQRAFGAEPMDLLRWASTPLPVLLDLLRNRFAGIGDPDQVRIFQPPNGEFMVEYAGYRFVRHAVAKEGDISTEALKRHKCIRLPRMAEMVTNPQAEYERTRIKSQPILPTQRALGRKVALHLPGDELGAAGAKCSLGDLSLK